MNLSHLFELAQIRKSIPPAGPSLWIYLSDVDDLPGATTECCPTKPRSLTALLIQCGLFLETFPAQTIGVAGLQGGTVLVVKFNLSAPATFQRSPAGKIVSTSFTLESPATNRDCLKCAKNVGHRKYCSSALSLRASPTRFLVWLCRLAGDQSADRQFPTLQRPARGR